jgi:hypothetical protein
MQVLFVDEGDMMQKNTPKKACTPMKKDMPIGIFKAAITWLYQLNLRLSCLLPCL